MTLRGRNVLLAVCGSIAAFKAAYIVRLLIKQGAEVRVIMTPSALDFITPLTLATLSGNPVYYTFTENNNDTWNNHVDIALWADILLIAPATENTIGKMANGICDNLLLAVYFSAKCPVYVCPAMDLDMYQHFSTKENLTKLQNNGVFVIEAETGELASGLFGQGRLAEPEHIVSFLVERIGYLSVLNNKKVLITAGPTYEHLDPVRFIGNHSSGKMGIELAIQAWKMGAEVTIVCGPIEQTLWNKLSKDISTVHVVSAQEMYAEVMLRIDQQDIAIFAAAVADYAPEIVSDVKIKKQEDSFTITLKKNPDIARECGSKKRKDQMFIGFALETNKEEFYAREKMKSKNLDAIVLNSLNDTGAGFSVDTNKITIFSNHKEPFLSDVQSKEKIAKEIMNYISVL
jgi:phosphopantothenoylcysteine decarboxylase/phosphopantothenate--cysteine ligase